MPADAEPLSMHHRPASESRRRRNARGAGQHPELRNAMRILTRTWVRERVPARLEACAGLRNDALRLPQWGKGGASAAASRQAGGQIAFVAMLRGERRRGRREGGGEDSG